MPHTSNGVYQTVVVVVKEPVKYTVKYSKTNGTIIFIELLHVQTAEMMDTIVIVRRRSTSTFEARYYYYCIASSLCRAREQIPAYRRRAAAQGRSGRLRGVSIHSFHSLHVCRISRRN